LNLPGQAGLGATFKDAAHATYFMVTFGNGRELTQLQVGLIPS
jgi:hypothetical protein